MSALIPILDKIVLDYLEDFSLSEKFGSQRLFSNVGYLAINFSVEGMILPKAGKNMNYDAMRPFNLLLTCLSIIAIVSFVKNLPKSESSENYKKSLVVLLKNFEYIFFLVLVVLAGISRAFMTNYLGLYYSKVLNFTHQKNSLNLPFGLNSVLNWAYRYKQSTTALFGVFLEFPLLWKSSLITDHLGLYWPILISQIFQLIRLISYYKLSYDNPNSFAWCCLIELAKGVSFSFMNSAALQLVVKLCPPDLKTTSQLIYNGCYVAIGTVLSGFIFKNAFSPYVVDATKAYKEFNNAFKWNIWFTVAGMSLFVIKYCIFRRNARM